MIIVDYREILRLRSLGNNITQIANAVHSSWDTIRDVEILADDSVSSLIRRIRKKIDIILLIAYNKDVKKVKKIKKLFSKG